MEISVYIDIAGAIYSRHSIPGVQQRGDQPPGLVGGSVGLIEGLQGSLDSAWKEPTNTY